MPLSMSNSGEKVLVFETRGTESIRQHLADLGFVPGTSVVVVSQHSGDVIVNLRQSHLAITKNLASKIMVSHVG